MIKKWLSSKYPNGEVQKTHSYSEQIEIGKYERFVYSEIKDIETQINPAQPETKTDQSVAKKYIAKEYALAYIFDLYAKDEQIPQNRTEGGYDAKKIKQIGEQKGLIADTFYRAVKKIAEYNLTDKKHLSAISKDWIGAVKTLTQDWGVTSKYLKTKNLLKE